MEAAVRREDDACRPLAIYFVKANKIRCSVALHYVGNLNIAVIVKVKGAQQSYVAATESINVIYYNAQKNVLVIKVSHCREESASARMYFFCADQITVTISIEVS